VRRLLSIALLSLALTSGGIARAQGAQSNANTPKLALHKMELWLAANEPKPAAADLDAGMGAATAVEERLAMLVNEVGAIASRRRTLLGQAATHRQKIAELRAERDAAKGENGIRRGNSDARIAELEQRAAALDAQAETLYGTMQRISAEEHSIVDAVERVRGVTDLIETSTIADAKQKQKAVVLATKTTKSIRLHASILMTVVAATSGTNASE
jgi:hypothetical protein